MARKPGAGGIVLVAAILGLVTAYFVWSYLRELKKQSEENWKPVVVATADIPNRTQLTPDMVTIVRLPPDHIAADAATHVETVVGKIAKEHIKAKDQVRNSDVVEQGKAPSLTYDIPPGKRAVAIGVNEITGVGATIQPGDRIDILATYTDPVARQETTQMILQNVPVLAVDRGRTEANTKEGGASSSVTLAIPPEDAELLTAADRAGVLRVALRSINDTNIVISAGTRAADILRGKIFEVPPAVTTGTNAEARSTPIIISPPRQQPREKLKIYRGTQETEFSTER